MRCSILVVVVAVAGCTSARPSPTGTTCPDPDPMTLTYDNFGRDFMQRYCVNCHSSQLRISMRNGAPLFHDFDSLFGVLEVPDHIDQQAGFGPKAKNSFMPGDGTGGRCPSHAGGALDEDCPQPTVEERTNLSLWIACERKRSHNLADAGVDGR